MKLYECIVDDGKNVFKTTVATKNRKELLNTYGGNGTLEKITDVTKGYLTEESTDKLEDDLLRTGWGDAERKLICALLEQHLKSIK